MKIEKEKQYTYHYTEYYCDECCKYIGRYDLEYDRLYKIHITSFKIPEFHLKMNRCFCCKECEEKARKELISNLMAIGFCGDDN